MRIAKIPVMLLSVLVIALTVVAVADAQQLTDPYDILNRSFEAAGGLDRLLAEQTSYFEGEMTYAGMSGTIKQWAERPDRLRAEVALGPLNITQGDNGVHAWTVDQNGKLQVMTNQDENTVKRRKVRRLIAEFAYADRSSDVFTVALTGVEMVGDKECYSVRVSNNINVDSYTLKIDTRTFAVERAVFIEDIESREAYYGDYRLVDGLQVPFWTKEVLFQAGQEIETRRLRYESNPPVDPALFEPPEQGTKDYQFTEGDRAEDIPITYVGDHIYISVNMNGKERLWVLDTGAGMTVLNEPFAKELKLPLIGEVKGQGAGGVVTANFTTLPPFQVAGIQFKEQTAAVIDMSELIRRLGLDVVGILGYDFLSRFVTKIDYANGRVSFYEPETFTYNGNGHVVDMHIEQSVFEVQATLDGTRAGSWLFDIGAATSSLDGRYALREGYATRDGVMYMGHGAGNEYPAKSVRCDSIEFAGYTVYKPPVNFPYGGPDTTFAADQIGVLGNSLFRNFVLYCDYARERLIVEPGDNFNQPWPLDKSGLQVAWTHDRQFEVNYVSPDTPADKAGFLKGDLIRSVNGIDVSLFSSVSAIRDLFKVEPGTKYDIVVERNNEDKRLTLTLAELL